MKKNFWKKVLSFLSTKVLFEEIKSVFFNKDVIVLLAAGPILLTLFFGGVYLHSFVEDIPIAVLDQDNSSLSRMIIQQFESSERFNLKYFVNSEEDLKALIGTKKADMGVYIPKGFSKNINKSQGAQVLTIVDGSNLIIGNNSYAAAAGIIQTIAAGTQIKLIESQGILPEVAEKTALAFKFNDRTLYDSRMTYMNYLLLGFVAVFLQQVMLSGVGISIIKDGEAIAEKNTFKRVILKILSCAFFAVISTFTAVCITKFVFNVQIRGNLFSAFLLCIAFIFAISCPALILAALLKDKLKFAQIALMLSLPTFVSCGYVWPQDQMPWMVALIIKIFWPLMNFARPFDEVIFKGLTLNDIRDNIWQLLLYILIWMPIGIIILKKRYKVTKQISNYSDCIETLPWGCDRDAHEASTDNGHMER